MVKRITVTLHKNDVENLSFLYKHFQIPNESETKRLTNVLACVVEGIRHGSQDEKHLGHEDEVRLLEGWDCNFRSLIWPFNRTSKKKEPKIICSHPLTREILRTNELYIATCRKCYDTGGSANLPALPEPKKQVSKPTPKPQQVQRLCEDCKIDISKQPSNHTLCRKCWFKQLKGAKAPGDAGHGEGLPGSSMRISQHQAARLRKLDARLKAAEHQTKEEIMKSAIEHGAEMDTYFAEHDHRMKQKQQPKEERT